MTNLHKNSIAACVGLTFIFLQFAVSYCVSHGPATSHMDAGTISFIYSATTNPSSPPRLPAQKFVVNPLELTDCTLVFPDVVPLHPQNTRQTLLPARASPA